MSKFLPQSALVKEKVTQAVRRAEGLKNGSYVRVKVGRKVGTILKHRAESEGLTIISEDEFQQRVAGTFKEPGTDAGTSEEPKSEG